MREEILKCLENLKEDSIERNKGVFIIEYDGVRLTFPSSKNSWNSIGAAKNALRNAIPYTGNWRKRLESIRELESEEIITYKRLT